MVKKQNVEQNEQDTDILSDYDIVPIDSNNSIAVPKDPSVPQYGSKEWHDYVMGHFEPNELMDGNPNCAALRRIAELLLGEIIDSGPVREYVASDANGPGRATVVFEVVFNWYNTGQIKRFREVADCWHGNTDDLFCAFPISTASTRAEGRALRKALKVKCLAAEEVPLKKDVASIVRQSINVESAPTTGAITKSENISQSQLNFLDVKCKQFNINVHQLINQFMSDPKNFPDIKKRSYSDITEVPKLVACKILELLSQIQRNEYQPPDNTSGYDKNWRNK
jgi:hypothetical protein